MDDYIPKPVDWDVLLETLERWTTHPAANGDRSSDSTTVVTMSHNQTDLNTDLDHQPASVPSSSRSATQANSLPSQSSHPSSLSNHHSIESNSSVETTQMSANVTNPQQPLDLERLIRVSRGKVSLQKRLLQAFIEATQTDLETLKACLDDRDGDRLTEIAHRLKGAAANVGATVMSDQSATLEQAAKDQNFEQVESHLKALLEQGRQIKEFMETLELS